MARAGLAVVTGAGGHLGGALVRALSARGRPVRAVDLRPGPALAGLAVPFVAADVGDPAALRQAFAGATTVFHLAARISIVGDPDGRVWATNVDGVRHAARAALDAGVRRFVHASSVHACDLEHAGGVVDETTPPATAPRLPVYDRSKAAGEAALLEVVAEGLDAVILRPTAILGPLDFGPSRMGRFFATVAAGRMPVCLGGAFDWVDVRDVAEAFVAAEARGRRGERYLVSGHHCSVAGLAALAAEAAGVAPPRVVVPLGLASLGARRGHHLDPALLFTAEALHALRYGRVVDGRKAARELGHDPRPLDRTVADAVAWVSGLRGLTTPPGSASTSRGPSGAGPRPSAAAPPSGRPGS